MVPLVDVVLRTLPWFGVVLAAVSGAFTVYTGVALAAALFHPDAATRREAAKMFRQLLQVVRFRPGNE
ncbi:hypothetical protein [Polymorphospora rubra]|uniref:hypothetical protein n=1 Tax=Polymorphospora rubra TaxID=338584 RepID=UPI0033F42538